MSAHAVPPLPSPHCSVGSLAQLKRCMGACTVLVERAVERLGNAQIRSCTATADKLTAHSVSLACLYIVFNDSLQYCFSRLPEIVLITNVLFTALSPC